MGTLEVVVERVVAGGHGLAREPGGRVVLVAGGLPGERVLARVDVERRGHLEATAVDVLDPSPGRRIAPCPAVAAGCGGCGWQHVDPAVQRQLKLDIVRDALRHQAGLPEAEVLDGPALATGAHRTTVRVAVDRGRAAYRAAASHDLVDVPEPGCLVAHPGLDELLRTGRFGSASEVVLRIGAATGERLVVATPTTEGIELPADVTVVAADAPGDAAVHEVVGGHRFRISARSFFQTRPDGAAALVEVVGEELEVLGARSHPGPMVDAYAGVGLFGALVAGHRRVLALESSPSSVHDARANLAGRDARVVRTDVRRWRPEPAAVVVADPARAGLGATGVDVLAATGARVLVLVSCDAASLGRDARLLSAHGFVLHRTTVVDLFPHTPHVEAVSGFVRLG